MVEALAELGVEYRRHQPDRAVHLRRLPRADPARHARPRATSTRSSTGTGPRRPRPDEEAAEAGRRGRARGRRGLRRGRRGRRQRGRRATSRTSRTARSASKDLTTVTAYDDETTELTYTCACGHARDRAAERARPRQAGLEGRLADALGVRGRGLRALRRRPLLARLVVRSSAGRSSREVFGGEQPIGPMYAFVGISGMAKMSSSKGGVPTPADALEIMEAPLLRWLYARRRPNQSFKIAFDQEIQRLYDEWDALDAQGRRRHRAARPTPPRTPAPSRTAAGALPRTPRPLPYRTLASVADITTGRRGADAAHPARPRPGRPARPRSTRSGPGWTGPSAGSPPRSRPSSAPRSATSRTPSCSASLDDDRARVAAAAARRAGRALVARRPDHAGLRRAEAAGRAARRTPSRRRS